MLYAVEHGGLDGSVVVHVLKRQTVTGLQRLGKTPIAYIVAAQT